MARRRGYSADSGTLSGAVFSRRLPYDLAPNALARARAACGEPRLDLTVSNPTRCGLPYPPDLLATLADPRALCYEPDPLGLAQAREAVAAEQARLGRRVDPARIVLTASTSEAYAFLFKLLADPGDSVLLPVPSYPLLEHLARLEGLGVRHYRLEREAGWQPDAHALPLADARAIVSVHPNNPTGTYLSSAAACAIEERCVSEDAAWIVDEVFLDFPVARADAAASTAGRARALTFTLGGLSKYVGLPQLKLSWIVVGGPPELVAEALARLAHVADNYLSVATPVQLALPRIFAALGGLRDAIVARCRENLAVLCREAARVAGVEVVPPGGGWSAVLRYPCVIDEEALAIELLREDGVAVHPGFLFDFAEPGWLVLSLLPPRATFEEGIAPVLARIGARL